MNKETTSRKVGRSSILAIDQRPASSQDAGFIAGNTDLLFDVPLAYPVAAYLEDVKGEPGLQLHLGDEGYLACDVWLELVTDGTVHGDVHRLAGSVHREYYVVTVTDVDLSGRTATLSISRPTNILPDLDRRHLRMLNPWWGDTVSRINEAAPWVQLAIIHGAELPSTDLDENVAIMQLTRADILEIEQYRGFEAGDFHGPGWSTFIWGPTRRPPLSAIGWRTGSPTHVSLTEEARVMLRALRLLHAGDLDLYPFITSKGHAYASLGKPDHRAKSGRKWEYDDRSSDALKTWINRLRSIAIDPESALARAFDRFDRTYSGDLYSRITDTTIAIETLTAPRQSGEISYRVRQKASFLASDDATTRMSDSIVVRDAYDVRSGIVHSNTRKSTATEELAFKVRDLLSRCIVRILSLDDSIVHRFATKGKHERIEEFLEALVLYNTLNSAQEHILRAATFKEGK